MGLSCSGGKFTVFRGDTCLRLGLLCNAGVMGVVIAAASVPDAYTEDRHVRVVLHR